MERLTEVESNTEMFTKMVARCVATNDVRNFIKKQARAKKAENQTDRRMVKILMKAKLKDACALASKLRSEKKHLCRQLSSLMMTQRWRYKRILKALKKSAREHRSRCDMKNTRKLKMCSHKMRELLTIDDAPKETMEVLDGVNVFTKADVVPEKPQDPMVCDRSIVLSEEEMMFLRRGPKFMMRTKSDRNEFELEVLKMIAKEKYSNPDGTMEKPDSVEDEEIERKAEVEEARSRLMYDKSTCVLEPSKLRATDYKYNRFVTGYV